jgi:hypothetical protein
VPLVLGEAAAIVALMLTECITMGHGKDCAVPLIETRRRARKISLNRCGRTAVLKYSV